MPDLYLATRAVRGKYKRPVSTADWGYIYIKRDGASVWLKPEIKPGETRVVEGWRIHYDSFENDVATFSVEKADE